MIVKQADLNLILNRRLRKRELRLPITYGKLGERKKCPMRSGGVYILRAPAPYARYRTEAATQLGRARAVLWLIEQCERPTKTVLVTVLDTEYIDDAYSVRFVLGDQRARFDHPRLLAARPGAPHGDYVTSASRALTGTADEVSAATQAIYAAEAANGRSEARNGLWRDERARLLNAVAEIRLEIAKQNVGSSTARRRLKTVEHNLRALVREIAA